MTSPDNPPRQALFDALRTAGFSQAFSAWVSEKTPAEQVTPTTNLVRDALHGPLNQAIQAAPIIEAITTESQ